MSAGSRAQAGSARDPGVFAVVPAVGLDDAEVGGRDEVGGGVGRRTGVAVVVGATADDGVRVVIETAGGAATACSACTSPIEALDSVRVPSKPVGPAPGRRRGPR